jgi:hypothetical protein
LHTPKHPCTRTEEFDDMSKDIETILNAIGEKKRTNGDRDERIKKLGDRTEKEDKTLWEKIDGKADKEDLRDLRNTIINIFIAISSILIVLISVLIVAIKLY